MEFVISRSEIFYLFIFGCFGLNAFTYYGSIDAQIIPDDEVKVLKAISWKIGNLNWNVTPHSCIDGGFKNETIDKENDIIRNVTCDCSFSNRKVCHVTNIVMTGLNLSGILPNEFGYLTHLQELVLFRNYLNGSIPRSFARAPLVALSLRANLITGTIPNEIGEITTLESLTLADNLLEGTLPSSLGKLKQLRKLDLAGNNFSGTIPESYGNLKKLELIALDGSDIKGKVPSFIENWIELREIFLRGTSLEGLIPTTISQLTKLQSLLISDLHGAATIRFPNLENLTSLEYLMLRNCSIHDSIPNYIGNMKNLSVLDLSFNKLTGEIPNNISGLISPMQMYMFLTANSLSGKIPE